MPRQPDADRRFFCYRHTNGTLHKKPHFVVMSGGGPVEYFASPFVKHWWREGDAEPTSQQQWRIAIARIAFRTLMKRHTQKQLEIGL